VTLGGRYYFMHVVSKKTIERLMAKEKNFESDFSAAAEEAKRGVSESGSAGKSSSDSTQAKEEMGIENISYKYVGGNGSLDYQHWVNSVDKNLGVIDVVLKPLTDLMTRSFFPNFDIEKTRSLVESIIIEKSKNAKTRPTIQFDIEKIPKMHPWGATTKSAFTHTKGKGDKDLWATTADGLNFTMDQTLFLDNERKHLYTKATAKLKEPGGDKTQFHASLGKKKLYTAPDGFKIYEVRGSRIPPEETKKEYTYNKHVQFDKLDEYYKSHRVTMTGKPGHIAYLHLKPDSNGNDDDGRVWMKDVALQQEKLKIILVEEEF
jgi:hypothetical protein